MHIPGGSPKFFLTGGHTPWPPIPTQRRVMGSFLNGISAIAEVFTPAQAVF